MNIKNVSAYKKRPMKVFFQIKMLSNSDMMLPHCISRLLDPAGIVAYAASQWI